MFWSKPADKSAAVLERINPAVELRISATPKTLHPDEKVKVYRQDVIAAEMIKKEVVLNPDIELDFSEERTLNENLIKAHWQNVISWLSFIRNWASKSIPYYLSSCPTM